MTATIPAPQTLQGDVVRLDPLTEADLPELFEAIGHSEVFAGGYGGGPAGYRDTLDGFVEFARSYYAWDGPGITFVARLLDRGGVSRVVGTSTLSDFDVPNEAAHIGWTAWSPTVWGTKVNPEAKLLMLDLAFAGGFGRVKLQADARNARSRAAIAKIGATFEGITRRDKLRADGTWRDAAIFSIIVDEWPAVRAGLVAQIAAAPSPKA
ncbi:GNAT family N-acetyltransferase [Amnibacterium flavum]|uniref:N-acetyltransferase n=1 Tax=Amnibacterium flavum TaxID=2173173 RepID=A0A2V1HW44_9MICO|nr:GNAT family protein [Amnibacterium flavum]PVZ95359.1 N-acetyltransferase [Amnibacterium flavum]